MGVSPSESIKNRTLLKEDRGGIGDDREGIARGAEAYSLHRAGITHHTSISIGKADLRIRSIFIANYLLNRLNVSKMRQILG